jgi:hypothetical protein
MDRCIYVLLFLINFCAAGASLAVFGQKKSKLLLLLTYHKNKHYLNTHASEAEKV